jgi:hypothetical protein
MIFNRDKNKKILDAVVKSNLMALLLELGYGYKGVKRKSSEAIPYMYSAIFTNKRVEREVEATYIPNTNGGREVFTLKISHTNFEYDEFDYTSTGSMTVEGINIFDLEGTLEEKLDKCINSWLPKLSNNYEKVLSGNNFETEHIDWQGLK